MNTLLFSERSIWTMLHGIVLGGGALLGLSAALYTLAAAGGTDRDTHTAHLVQGRRLSSLLTATTVLLWLTVLAGTYISFPDYRAAPPEGVTDLASYPRSLLMANDNTRWLHAFAMEIKEHMPWIAAMLTTAVAVVGVRDKRRLLVDSSLRRMATSLLAISFLLVAFVSLLGIFINKVAPLQ